jgi:hypothetical protein
MKKPISIALTMLMLTLSQACNQSETVDKSKADSNLLIGLLAGQNAGLASGISSELSKDFVLNGRWNAFTGNGTTSTQITTIQAKNGQTGLQLDDSTAFGGTSSCYVITEFNNTEGSYITQNPENNGACFTGDTNKGKYNKNFFFANTAKSNSYWSCQVAFGKTLAEARAQTDTSTRTSPGTAGCGTFAFSRLELRQ